MRKFLIRAVGNAGVMEKDEGLNLQDIKTFYIDSIRIGDFVIITSLLKELKKQMPWIKIIVSHHKSVTPFIENSNFVDMGLPYEDGKKKQIKIVRLFNEFVDALKKRGKYDLYFDNEKRVNFLYILNRKIMKVKCLIGLEKYEKYGIKARELSLYKRYISRGPREHYVDIIQKILDSLGLDKGDGKYAIDLGSDEGVYKDFFSKENVNIIFNFKGSDEKRSLTEFEWIEILKKISASRAEVRVYISSDPKNYEEIKKIMEIENIKNVELLPKTERITELASLIKYSDMVVTVDTSIVHISSAYNKPIISIYRANDDIATSYFGPKTDMYEIILRDEKLNFDDIKKIIDYSKKYVDIIMNQKKK